MEWAVGALHDHIGHVGVPQEELDRPEPDDLIGHLVGRPCQLALQQDRAARAEEVARGARGEPCVSPSALRERRSTGALLVTDFTDLVTDSELSSLGCSLAWEVRGGRDTPFCLLISPFLQPLRPRIPTFPHPQEIP
jgi:hypothetical protein